MCDDKVFTMSVGQREVDINAHQIINVIANGGIGEITFLLKDYLAMLRI